MPILTKNGAILINNGDALVFSGDGTVSLTSLTITPTESSQTFNHSGYDGYDTVVCNAISSTYIGSGITNRSSTNLTASGATVTAPAGYYAEDATKSVTTMSLPTSAAASATSGYTSKATISRSTSDQYINIAPGYNSAGGYYKISAVADGTAGTPTATKGTVSNNSISITPSVTNTTGYITGSTKTGTAVSVSASELVSGTKSITANGTGIDVTNYAAVDVAVPTGSTINNKPSQTITPTESEQTIGYSSPYTGLEEVVVAAISSTYLGSGITSRSSTDLSASGATVTVPAGYYSTQATKSVTTMTLPTAATASATSGYTSKATISRSTSDQYINIPTGYNDTASYYKISAVANGSATGPSSLSGTSATVSTGTNTLTLTKTGITTTPTVSAGYVSSATASTATVTLTASVTTKAAATYYPSTSDQSISASQYLTGAQTIKAVVVSGLSADKILSGTTVKVGDTADDDRITSVSGSVTFQTYYTGSGTPSSSLGVNGDIYLQT